jgi:hypothetical protein
MSKGIVSKSVSRSTNQLVKDISRILGSRKHWDTMDRIIYNGVVGGLLMSTDKELV